MTTFKKFKSPDGTERRIASTMGWIFLVDGDYQNIPEYAWSECYALGCVSKDMFQAGALNDADSKVVKQLSKVAERENAIMNLMRKWVDGNERLMFDKGGNPIATEIRDELHITISRDERDRCWKNLQDEKSE